MPNNSNNVLLFKIVPLQLRYYFPGPGLASAIDNGIGIDRCIYKLHLVKIVIDIDTVIKKLTEGDIPGDNLISLHFFNIKLTPTNNKQYS